MNDIIPINPATIGGQSRPAVDARHLYEKLEVQSKFAVWINRRIDELDLRIGNDFAVFPIFGKNIEISGENIQSGRPAQEYSLTLRAAMKIAIAEGTERGDLLRDQLVDLLEQNMMNPAPALANSLERIEAKNIELENRVTELQDDLDALKPCTETGFAEDRVAIEALPKILYADESLPSVLHIDVDEVIKDLVTEGLVLIIRGKPVTTSKAIKSGLMINKGRFYANGKTKPIPYLTQDGVRHMTELYRRRMEKTDKIRGWVPVRRF